MTYKTIHSQQRPDGTWLQPLADGLGTIRAEVDETLEIDATSHYTPYGNPFGQTGTSATPFAFTGEERDANGLQYHRARYYAPGVGVWPSLDPLEGEVVQAMPLNRYGYVGGNSVNLADPRGYAPECQTSCTVGRLLPDPGGDSTKDRCQITYSYFGALSWAFYRSQDEIPPLRPEISGTLCVVFMYFALRSGGMPELSDPDPSTGYQRNLGLCHPLTGEAECKLNARGVPYFGSRFLDRGVYHQNERYRFKPPVERISQEDALQIGDIIYQKVGEPVINYGNVSFDHVALVVGWGPRMTVTERDEESQNSSGSRPDLGITGYKVSPDQVPWVIDEQTAAGHPPVMRPFRVELTKDLAPGGYQQGITRIYRIPPTFSIHKGYLEASTP